MKCPECNALMINGFFCHESTCPNKKAFWDGSEWVHYYECRECGDNVRKGETCFCMEPAEEEIETPFVCMTFGTMPTKEEFLSAFRQNVGTGKYRVRNSPYFGNKPIQSDDYTAEELFAEVERCANLFNNVTDDASEYDQKQAEEAGLMASCIMQTLRFEWV